MSDTIRGYRVIGDTKPDRQLSTNYLMLKPEGAKALAALKKRVDEEERKHDQGEGPGVPCVRNPDKFSGENLPTDREAKLGCAPCPAKAECRLYLLLARPPHGVYDGEVRRMEIPDDET